MSKIINKTFNFFKKEIVFSISSILAFISCFFVKPNPLYLDYINWKTIIILLIIMFIVEFLKNLAIFEILVHELLNKVKTSRELVLFLVFTCFFSSIIITNDVSLIIFVPFSILALKKIDRSNLIIFTVSLQTIAANIGCMVLPTGSPHNIVMYTVSNISFLSFFLLLLPYVIVSFVFLVVSCLFIPSEKIIIPTLSKIKFDKTNFFKRVFFGVDYYLILTFIALFIFIGNLENILFFSMLFKKWISGNEVFWGVIASQVISNVPAAMLLSGFSNNYESIIIGINIGGLGTLIASMANLISYKIVIHEFDCFKIRYLLVFTVMNVILLIILLCVFYFLNYSF